MSKVAPGEADLGTRPNGSSQEVLKGLIEVTLNMVYKKFQVVLFLNFSGISLVLLLICCLIFQQLLDQFS